MISVTTATVMSMVANPGEREMREMRERWKKNQRKNGERKKGKGGK